MLMMMMTCAGLAICSYAYCTPYPTTWCIVTDKVPVVSVTQREIPVSVVREAGGNGLKQIP